jgi:NADH:ubiquinone oxidoreductase subunit 6 (subunit J)
MIDPIEVLVAALIIAAALTAAEVKSPIRMAISFSIMSIFIAIAFYLMDAPYVSVFQLAINAGAVTVLFLAMLHVLKKRRAD